VQWLRQAATGIRRVGLYFARAHFFFAHAGYLMPPGRHPLGLRRELAQALIPRSTSTPTDLDSGRPISNNLGRVTAGIDRSLALLEEDHGSVLAL